MKIVINRCYGGFGISTKALMLLIKRKAKCIKKYKVSEYYGGSDKIERDFKYKKEDLGNGFYVIGICDLITDKKFIYSLKYGDEIRKDLELIKVIEELGKEADGNHAELKIVEIPEGTNYEIDEYDGSESIHEVHRSWS